MTDTQSPPSSEFILKRIIKNDAQNTPGWKLNAEMRGEFTKMLAEREQRKGMGR